MKATVKSDSSALISSLLLASAVVAAATPVLLGDRLVPLVSGAITEGTLLLQSISISLQSLFS